MVVAEAVELGHSIVGSAEPGMAPLHTSQLPAWQVHMVVRLVLEAELDLLVDLDVLVEVQELLLLLALLS
eukprot:11783773-Prorocentrum_lima.AAC.1